MMWDQFHNRWQFTGTMVANTAIRVGAGSESYDPLSTDLPVVRDERGQPYIPGSSLKGVLRARLEQLVRTLENPPQGSGTKSAHLPWNGRGACDPLDHNRCCVPNEVAEHLRASDPNRWPQAVYQRSCRICRTFGSQWLAGKVSIPDLYPVSEAEVSSELRDGVSIDRDKGTVNNKFDFQVVSAGSTFVFNAYAENLDPDHDEPGLLLIVLEELKSGMLRVGGFKSRGLGVVELKDLRVTRVNAPQRGNAASIKRYLEYLQGKLPTPLSDEAIDDLVWECVSHLTGEERGDTHA